MPLIVKKMDLFPWDVDVIKFKKWPSIWNGLIKFGNREVVELLKPRMITRKNQWKLIFGDWYN